MQDILIWSNLVLIMGAGIQTVCVHAACECVHVIWCVLAYVDACACMCMCVCVCMLRVCVCVCVMKERGRRLWCHVGTLEV